LTHSRGVILTIARERITWLTELKPREFFPQGDEKATIRRLCGVVTAESPHL